MRALIIGAGNAGSILAAKLCQEKNDVVVIDSRIEPLRELEAQLDVMTVQGHGSSPLTLQNAELGKADLVVGVTNSDDINILACMQASRAGVLFKVARVANHDFMSNTSFFSLADIGLDLAINPIDACAREIFNMLRLPGAFEVVDMMGGRVYAVGAKLDAEAPLLGMPLKSCPHRELIDNIRFIGLIRDGDFSIPDGETRFVEGDDVYLVGKPPSVREFLAWVSPRSRSVDKVVIAGGGQLGVSLARLLETATVPTVLMESNNSQAEACSRQLDKTTVIWGDSLKQESLENAGFTKNTAFIAALGDDENNIISCLMARNFGACDTTALVSDPQYVPIIDNLTTLGHAVSVHLSLINSILHFIRGKNVRAAILLQSLPGELLEVSLTDENKWVGKYIKEFNLPKGSIIATVLRNGKVFVPTGDLRLMTGDRLIIFSLPHALNRLKKIF